MRLRATLTTLLASAAVTVAFCGIAVGAATTASAAPAANHRPGAVRAITATAVRATPQVPAVTPETDATLSGLSVTGASVGPMGPSFDPATHVYEVVGNDDSPVTVTPTVEAGGATAVVTSAGTTYPLSGGAATVPLVNGRNDIAVTVTSEDASSTSVYVVTVWRLAAPTSQIVRLSGATSTVFGGARMTVTLSDGTLPNNCFREYQVGAEQANLVSSTFDPATGLTTDIVSIPESDNRAAGTADLVLTNVCFPAGEIAVVASTTSVNAVTYTAGFTVTGVDMPTSITTGTAIVIHGAGVSAGADIRAWVTDPGFVSPPGGERIRRDVGRSNSAHPNDEGPPQGNIRDLSTWGWTGDGNLTVYPNYAWGDTWYAGSNQRTVHVGYCPLDSEGTTSACTSLFSKVVTWTPPTPSNVSFSPSSGPVAGGTMVSLRGRFIVSGTENLTVKVGNQTVPDWNTASEAAGNEDFLGYTQGLDVITFPAPAATATGPVSITVTNDVGSTVARGTFTYSDRPTVTSIAPASVANSGGSVITVKGTAFGASGTPSVIIGDAKSPLVTRVSDTELTAVVPASVGTTGSVNVSVSSQQGGGISLPSVLQLVAPTTRPTVSKVSPASGQVGDDVTLTGTGFGAAGTVGVSVDGQWSLVTASSSTSIMFEVPATDTTGVKDLVVGATTGTVTKADAFTVQPADGIASVTPATVPSYATGTSDTVALDGAGFATKGTVKVGSATAVAYTATAAGTHIAGVRVPTSAAGVLSIVVTPTGSKTPMQASVTVTGPSLSYVGSDPANAVYGPADINSGQGGEVLDVPTTGGSAMRIDGSGFGSAGVLTIGSTAVTTTTWTDSAITFLAPGHGAGTLAITVKPTGSTLVATRAAGVDYVIPAVGVPTIGQIASVVPNGSADRNEFDPPNDVSDAFTLAGTNLAGTDSTATQIVLTDGNQTFTVVPTSVSPTSLTFGAPRGFTNAGWKALEVVTNVGSDQINYGILYQEAGVQLNASPNSGLCLRSDTPATGAVTYDPAVVTITNSGELFGDSGTVSIDGVSVTPTSYASGQVVISMANLASDLAQPWGNKSIVVTPDDTTLPPSSVGFTCGVTPTVTTTVNGSTDPLTVPAGTAYTLGNTTTGFIGTTPFTATAPADDEYVTAADFAATGFDQNVQGGAPVGAGDYYIRVALSRATYDHAPYLAFEAAPVHVTITGSPVTITPVSDNGASFAYKGQLGDGTAGSSSDFHYTATSTSDPITAVTWEYRDSICESQGATAGWISGLPKNVAMSDQNCGGDGNTPSSWDVRVASFAMTSSGADRSIFYEATEPTTQVTITPRNLTVTGLRADKVYDGTTTATVGTPTLTGAIAGDDVSVANGDGAATFASAAAGVNKPVTLSADLTLTGQTAEDYTLTNPRPTIVGTIAKAPAVLSLAASTSSVLLSQNTPVTITPMVDNAVTGSPVDDTAAAVALSSQTPTICTISAMTVTAHKAGTCTIAGTQAGSTNYTAATAASDPTSTTETVEINVFPAPQAISVIADDFTAAVGDTLDPTSQVSGLFDGDTVSGVDYHYYSGTTLLTTPPVAAGTYKVVPFGGSLTAANPAVYSNPTSFTYVAGTLVITAVPPTITSVSPPSGPTTGGTKVTITGTLLGTVKMVHIGAVTLRVGNFTVNADGTTLTFLTPKVAKPGAVDLTLVAGTATAADSYTYTKRPTSPVKAPGAPTREGAAGHTQKVVVTFTPPASNGGAAITSYQFSINGHAWRTVTTKPGAHGTRSATLTGLENGRRYSVRVRAVNSHGAGPASKAHNAIPNAPKLGTDRPIPASEIAIPKHPKDYAGPRAYTRAFDTSHNGTWAHPIPDIGSRQLTVGEAATLSKSSLFGFNSDVLTKDGHAEVAFLARHLRLAHAVSCEGYTDYAGDAGHEKTLSEGRADAVCKALVHDGAHVTFTTHGYGGDRPVVVGGSPQSRAANRRVVVLVTR